MLLRYPRFPGKEENKKGYGSLRLFNIFKKYFTDYDSAALLYKKCAKSLGIVAQFSLRFPGGKWVAWKKIKASNISDIMSPTFFNLSACGWENNGLLNRITGMIITSWIKVIVRVTCHNFDYIPAILGPVLLKCLHQLCYRGRQHNCHII